MNREVTMSIESDFFRKKRFIFSSLEEFGFIKSDQEYIYCQTFMDNDFKAIITISLDGKIAGKVIDSALEEEYLPLRAANYNGSFVGEVRSAYMAILGDISDSCCKDLLFTKDQSNRLAEKIAKTFEDSVDYPFAKHPQYASYRVSGKWYALLFPLKMGKLENVPAQLSEDEVEVLNIKVNPQDMEILLQKEGIYPSYHMSKKTWVSIVLDNTLSDIEIFKLVSDSRKLVSPNKKSNSEPEFWIIPANPKFYDIDKEFAEHQLIDWTQKGKIAVGDYVFIYITAPIRALRYVCQVIERDLKTSTYLGARDVKAYMRLKLIRQFEDSTYLVAFLAEHGVKTVRGPRRMTKELRQVMAKTILE